MNNVHEHKAENQISNMSEIKEKKLKKRIWKNILFEVRNQIIIPKQELVH